MTDGPFGSNLKSAHYVETGPRVIRLQNIGFGEFFDERAHIAQEHFEELRAHEVVGGDLVLASLGEDLPRACIIPDTVGPAIVKADCIRVRLHRGIDSRYVNYAMQRPALRRAVRDQIHGVGRPRLGMGGIRELSVPLPSIEAQERIVAALEEHLSRLDAAGALLRMADARISLLRSKIMESLIQDAPLASLRDLSIDSRYGTSVKCSYEASGIGVIRIPNIVGEQVDSKDLKYSTVPEGLLTSVLVGDGDLFFVRTNGSRDLIGRAAVASGVAVGLGFASYLIRYRFPDHVDPKYVCAAVSAPSIRGTLEQMAATTAGQYNLSISKLDTVSIPVPSLETQRRLVAERAKALDAIARLATALDAARLRGQRLRRSVLAAAFSGQLVPQDPTDEPASVLLKRIRAERGAQPQTGRARKVIS